MQCEYFGICGSCRLYEDGYQGQLTSKTQTIQEQFLPYFNGKISIFESKEEHYRSRAEFKIYHDDEGSFYAMNRADKQGVVKITNCSIVHESIARIMTPLLEKIKEHSLGYKLFGIDFLTSSSGEVLASLIYHRALDETVECERSAYRKRTWYLYHRTKSQAKNCSIAKIMSPKRFI